MKDQVDLLVHSIGQLCTVPSQNGGPQRGSALGTLGLIENAAIAVHEGRVVAIGSDIELRDRFEGATTLNAEGRLVTPGLVDPHTHLIWAGDRADEFEQRVAGATYQQIMAAGGGIVRTVQATRQADLNTLVEQSKPRLAAMLAHGSTSVEVKTGYGLSTPHELALLNTAALLDSEHPVDIALTFLGAHAVPPEFNGNADGYVDLIIDEMLPAVVEWRAEHWPGTLFCDVFCETGAFNLDQTRRILEAAAGYGMALKVHVDEFESLGGARLAVELGAVSVDHIVATPDDEIDAIAASNTVAVALPSTPFGLGQTRYANARRFIDAGAALAIATDCNPGTAWNENMQFVMALSTRYLHLTPAEALAAATINAAYAIGRGDEVGSLEVGKLGDLVIWDVPAYQHLSYRFGRNLAQVVVKRGKIAFHAWWAGVVL